MKKIFFTLLSFTFLSSCYEDEVKKPIDVSYDNSIMVSIQQDNTDKYTVLTTIDSIYKGGYYRGRIIHNDTIPSLGEVTEIFDTEEITQDESGNDVYKTETIKHQMSYQLYINVAKK